MKKRSRQSGTSLIDLMIGVAAILIISVIFIAFAKNFSLAKTVSRESRLIASGADAMDRYLNKFALNILSGSVPGVANPLAPSREELIALGVLPSSFATRSEFGGQITFKVRIGAFNNLMALTCDPETIVDQGIPSPALAGRIAASIEGGVSTSKAKPAILHGGTYHNVASDVSSEALVCSIRTLANPT